MSPGWAYNGEGCVRRMPRCGCGGAAGPGPTGRSARSCCPPSPPRRRPGSTGSPGGDECQDVDIVSCFNRESDRERERERKRD